MKRGTVAYRFPTADGKGTYISAGKSARDKTFISEHPGLVEEGIFLTLEERAEEERLTEALGDLVEEVSSQCGANQYETLDAAAEAVKIYR